MDLEFWPKKAFSELNNTTQHCRRRCRPRRALCQDGCSVWAKHGQGRVSNHGAASAPRARRHAAATRTASAGAPRAGARDAGSSGSAARALPRPAGCRERSRRGRRARQPLAHRGELAEDNGDAGRAGAAGGTAPERLH